MAQTGLFLLLLAGDMASIYCLPMSTLAEIEVAAEKLPITEKEALIVFLTARLQKDRTALSQGRSLGEFSGVLRLCEDPLAWQQRVRGEWE